MTADQTRYPVRHCKASSPRATFSSAYRGGVGEGNGDILVLGNVTWGQNTTLTLSALHDIIFNGEITVSNTGAGNLVLRADNTGGGKGTLFLNAGSVPERVDWRGSTGQVSIYYNPIGGYTTPQDFSTGNGRVAVNSASQLTSYMLVNTATNLQNISTNLAGTYALGKDIDASGLPITPTRQHPADTVHRQVSMASAASVATAQSAT